MARARTLSLTILRAECVRLRDHLIRVGASGAEELAASAPGGAENPDTGPRGVMVWHGLLHQAFSRYQSRAATTPTVGSRDAERAALAALSREPETLTLLVPLTDDDGPRRRVSVHPKAPAALFWLAQQNEWLGELMRHREVIAPSQAAADRDLVARVDREAAYCLAAIAWILAHPTPGLPYEDQDRPPAVPDWCLRLDPADLLQIQRANERVNGQRLALLSHLVGGTTTGPRTPRWSVFFAGAAAEMGVTSSVLMRDWSLGEILATTLLAAEGKREAHEAAKAASKRTTGPVTAGRFA